MTMVGGMVVRRTVTAWAELFPCRRLIGASRARSSSASSGIQQQAHKNGLAGTSHSIWLRQHFFFKPCLILIKRESCGYILA